MEPTKSYRSAKGKNAEARAFMNTDVQTVTPDMTLYQLIGFLLEHEISNAPVVRHEADGKRILVGFVTEGDCLKALSSEIFHGVPIQPKTVEMVMRLHPISVGPETDIFTLASILISFGYRHLPVVEDHHLLGIVSRRDVIRALDEYAQEQTRKKGSFPPVSFLDRAFQKFGLLRTPAGSGGPSGKR